MKEEKLYNAITNVKEVYIEEARTAKLNKQKVYWKKWITIAASFIIVIGIGSIFVLHDLLPFGGNDNGGAGCGGAGHDESSIFMSYEGPVFPLSLGEVSEEIEVARNIIYDFSVEDENSTHVWGSEVKDSYKLSNNSNVNVEQHGIYPFVGSFDDLQEQLPKITIDGQEVAFKLHAGSYSGGFTGTDGEDDTNVSLNIKEPRSWEDYKELLADGSYQTNAFDSYKVLNQPVTVYTFSPDQLAPEDYKAATQAISFAIDPKKTTILQYGFNGGEYGKDGFRRFSYFVPNGIRQATDMKMLIVIGEDITDYELQGYKNGACEAGNELDGITATITREDRILSDIINQIVDNFITKYDEVELIKDMKDMFSGAVSEAMIQYGLLSDSVRNRYQEGMLEDIITDVMTTKRVFYTEFELGIPARGSVSVSAQMHKKPSFDYAGSGSGNEGIQGYDMVTQLGTNLLFIEMTAEIKNFEHIKIMRQNYGFDLSQGLTKVTLNPSLERYYIEIRPLG